MFKIASVSLGLRPRPRWGSLRRSPDPLVVRGFLPSAIAVSRLRRLIPISPPNKNTRPISPHKHKILEPPLVVPTYCHRVERETRGTCNYRQVRLTSVVLKAVERIVKDNAAVHLKNEYDKAINNST